MPKKVRVGVIGAGSWAVHNHIPVLAARHDVELTVVNRRDADAARYIKDKFGFSFSTTDFRDVLKHDLDAVIVSSPLALHYEHVASALERGIHVLCEKPFTATSQEAWSLVDLAKKNNCHLLLAYGWNYKRMVCKAKELMRDRGIGTIESIMIQMASPLRGLLKGSYEGLGEEFSPRAETYADPNVSGGGYAQAALTHALALAFYLSELRGKEVYATINTANTNVDLHDAYTIRFTNGAVGTLFGACSPWGEFKHQLQVRIYGNEGQLILDLEREHLWLYRSKDDQFRYVPDPGEGSYECEQPLHTLINLSQGLLEENRSPGELGAKTVEIIEAAYKSIYSSLPERIGV